MDQPPAFLDVRQCKWTLPLVIACLIAVGCDGVSTSTGTSGAPMNNNNTGNNNTVNNGGTVQVPDEIEVGRVTLHRLNRVEYNNTVRDLLDDQTEPAADFPEDDFGYGFNNIADVLSLSTLHLEGYEKAAESLIDTALESGQIESTVETYEAEEAGGTSGGESGSYWNLWGVGEVVVPIVVAADGTYRISTRVYGQQAGPDLTRIEIRVGGVPVHAQDVAAVQSNPEIVEVETQLNAGPVDISVAFLNDFYDPDAGEDRNLLVDWIEIEGPTDAFGEPSGERERILTCAAETSECAAEIIAGFGRRAWRRPLEDDEVQRLAGFVEIARSQGDGFEQGIRLALRAMLVSPHFVFRVELDPDGVDTPHRLSDHEMASRLSYFLWSSMPDEALFALAEQGALQDDTTLRQEVMRMLDDPKSVALVDQFATQWLYIDAILDAEPEYSLFPEYGVELGRAMRKESRMLFANLLDIDAPVGELLTADYSFVNEPLADHYGLSGVVGDEHVRVQVDPSTRMGMLSHAGLLTSLSFPKRTSPVRRGAWVLGNLICEAPAAPPPGVENLPTDEGETVAGTIREQMARHATDPTCAGCHQMMDPIGFGLEPFDAIGRFRELDNGLPIDAQGDLPDGRTFTGAVELAQILAADEKYARCVVEKTLTYALGRGLERWDRPQITALVEAAGGLDATFRGVMTEIVLSDAFRSRRNGPLPGEEE
jgi:hypothetical protein